MQAGFEGIEGQYSEKSLRGYNLSIYELLEGKGIVADDEYISNISIQYSGKGPLLTFSVKQRPTAYEIEKGIIDAVTRN